MKTWPLAYEDSYQRAVRHSQSNGMLPSIKFFRLPNDCSDQPQFFKDSYYSWCSVPLPLRVPLVSSDRRPLTESCKWKGWECLEECWMKSRSNSKPPKHLKFCFPLEDGHWMNELRLLIEISRQEIRCPFMLTIRFEYLISIDS